MTAALVLSPTFGTTALLAQGRPMEIRLDFIGFETSDGDSSIELGFPGTLSLAFFMTPQFALEPSVSLTNVSSDLFDGTVYGFGLFFPFFLKPDHGKSGFFVSPGLALTGGSGDFDGDNEINYGLDVGFKNPVRDKVSLRFALTLRDGDSYSKAAFGGTFGIGLHWQ